MVIAEINILDKGSTGKIMLQIAEKVRDCGGTAITFSKGWKLNDKKESHYFVGNYFFNGINYTVGSTFGLNGFLSLFSTLKMISTIKKMKVELVHIHNLHDYCFNIPVLFRFLRSSNIPVVWTLHDCWAFTGRCPYFQLTGCNKWKCGCGNCIYDKALYPKALIDITKFSWKFKKKTFTSLDNLYVVTPSEWLAKLVRQSYLNKYPLEVINNGIDLGVFKPMTLSDEIKQILNLNLSEHNKKHLILGVSFSWGERKGLDVFIALSQRLSDKYQIILVGTDDDVDKKLPKNIISIHRTHNQKELAEIYSAADLFVNPTREDNYPTVNMEALACGTPVITFKTGGSPEIIDETCGSVVECDDVYALEKEIIYRCEVNPFSRAACLKRAESFDMYKRFEEYVKLYENMVNEKR